VDVHVDQPVGASGVAKDLWNDDTVPVRNGRAALSLDDDAFSLLELGPEPVGRSR
jgi:hypothetical protein